MKFRNGAATDSLVLTFVRVVTACISILIYKLLAVNFSLDEYGVYSQAVLVSTTVTAITIMGMTDAINYFYNKDKGGEIGKSYVETIFALQIVIGLLGAFFILIFKEQIAEYFKEPQVAGLMIYVAFIPLLTNITNMLQVLFISYRRAKVIAIRNLLFSLFKVVAVFFASYLFKSIEIVLINSLVLDIAIVVYMVFYSRKHFFVIDVRKARFFQSKEIFAYSIPMAMFIITNSLSRNLDKLVIGWFASTEDLALYSIAAKELPLDMLTSSFITVLVPYITRYIAGKEFDKAASIFSKYIQISYTITWLIAGGAIAEARDLMVILYDSKYLSAVAIFVLYIVVDMFRFANTSIIFAAQGKTKELIIYSGSSVLLNFVLNIWLYKIFGITGPAIATVITTLLLSFIILARSGQLLKSNLIELVNIKQMILLLMEIIICGIVAHFIRISFFGGLPSLIAFGLTYAIYGIPLFALNYKRIFALLRDINSVKMR